jgi:MEMO1 family protein
MTARPTATRRAAVAGRFYPADPRQLAADVDGMLAAVARAAPPGPVGIIAPHAGYRYSGPIAATAYRHLALRQDAVRRVLLLGPDHFTGLPGMAVPSSAAFATPLGDIPLDSAACALTASLPDVVVSDTRHAREHSLEVHLPFLQRSLYPDIPVIPVLVGLAAPSRVAHVIDMLWQDDSTTVVLSTDLSHYHDHATACRLDRRTADAIVRADPAAIGEGDACGRFPLRGLLELARRRKLRVQLLDLRTSADTAGDPSRVVGYGAFGVYR